MNNSLSYYDVLHIWEDLETDDSQEEALGTTIELPEGTCVRENWLWNWKTGINFCVL